MKGPGQAYERHLGGRGNRGGHGRGISIYFITKLHDKGDLKCLRDYFSSSH